MQDKLPMVSICCITFKHENYIRECLDGFIMQKTDFPFEVIVHDDASPDKTADIIREYEARYPDIRSYAIPDNAELLLVSPGDAGSHFLLNVPDLKGEKVPGNRGGDEK